MSIWPLGPLFQQEQVCPLSRVSELSVFVSINWELNFPGSLYTKTPATLGL